MGVMARGHCRDWPCCGIRFSRSINSRGVSCSWQGVGLRWACVVGWPACRAGCWQLSRPLQMRPAWGRGVNAGPTPPSDAGWCSHPPGVAQRCAAAFAAGVATPGHRGADRAGGRWPCACQGSVWCTLDEQTRMPVQQLMVTRSTQGELSIHAAAAGRWFCSVCHHAAGQGRGRAGMCASACALPRWHPGHRCVGHDRCRSRCGLPVRGRIGLTTNGASWRWSSRRHSGPGF